MIKCERHIDTLTFEENDGNDEGAIVRFKFDNLRIWFKILNKLYVMTLKELVFMQKSNNPELNHSKYCILPFLELKNPKQQELLLHVLFDLIRFRLSYK